MIKLDIGSGQAHNGDGWLGVDPYSDTADVRAFMWDLPYDDNTVDEIYSSHALEHVERFYTLKVLKEWCRVLKPGGKVNVCVPNIIWCMHHYLDYVEKYETEYNPVLGWEQSIIIGSQEPGSEGMVHRMIFTENSLKWFLRQAGFSDISVTHISTHSQDTLQGIAFK